MIPVTELINVRPNPWVLSVALFQKAVLHNDLPETPEFNASAAQAPDFLHEEVEELAEAYREGDLPKTIDALVDLIFYAIGMAYQMGVDLTPYFFEVALANMRKEHDPTAVPGVNKRCIKPEGWQEPRIKEIMEAINDRRRG